MLQASTLKSAIYDRDPYMVRAIVAQNAIDIAMAPYKAVLNDMKKRRAQFSITMFLQRTNIPGPGCFCTHMPWVEILREFSIYAEVCSP